VIIMLVILAAQSFVIVKQHEKALIFRFGNLRKTVGTGLHIIMPYPIEEARIFEVARTKQVEGSSFMFDPGKSGSEVPAVLRPGFDGYLLSAGINIIHARYVLAYSVESSNQDSIFNYFIKYPDSEKTLKTLIENALLKAAAGLQVEDILANPEKFRSRTASELRTGIAKAGLGISFEGKDLSITSIPPRQAKSAFDALSQANQDADKIINEAESYKIKTSKDGQFSADLIVARAEGDMAKIVATSKTDADIFEKKVALFTKNPNLTARTIYEEAIYRILKSVNEKFVIKTSEDKQIRIQLGRNPDKTGTEKKDNEASNP
jgi:membrane protease subunit HflK